MKKLPELDHPKSPHIVIRQSDVYEIDYIFDKIRNREYFSFVKLTFGFFHRLIESGLEKVLLNDSSTTGLMKIAEKHSEIVNSEINQHWKITPQTMYESLLVLKKALKSPNLLIGFSHVLLNELNDPPKERAFKPMYEALTKKGFKYYNAIVWRNIVISMRFFEFVDLIRDMNVIFVTPSYNDLTKGAFDMKKVGKLLKLPKFYHISIPYYAASYDVDEIEAEILALDKTLKGDKCYILQGAHVADQLIYRLHDRLERSFLLNWGRALNILDDNKFFNSGWKIRFYDYIIPWFNEEIKKL